MSDELTTCQFGHDGRIVTDRPLSKCEEGIRKIIAEEVPQGVAFQEAPQGQSADDSSMPSTGSILALHQLELRTAATTPKEVHLTDDRQ